MTTMNKNLFPSNLILADVYLFKVSTRTRCEICSKLTVKKPEQRQKLSLARFLNKGLNKEKEYLHEIPQI